MLSKTRRILLAMMAVRLRHQEPNLTSLSDQTQMGNVTYSKPSLLKKAAMIVRLLPFLPAVGALGLPEKAAVGFSHFPTVAAPRPAGHWPHEAICSDIPRSCAQTPRTLTSSKGRLMAVVQLRHRFTLTARRKSRSNLRLAITARPGNLRLRWKTARANRLLKVIR